MILSALQFRVGLWLMHSLFQALLLRLANRLDAAILHNTLKSRRSREMRFLTHLLLVAFGGLQVTHILLLFRNVYLYRLLLLSLHDRHRDSENTIDIVRLCLICSNDLGQTH